MLAFMLLIVLSVLSVATVATACDRCGPLPGIVTMESQTLDVQCFHYFITSPSHLEALVPFRTLNNVEAKSLYRINYVAVAWRSTPLKYPLVTHCDYYTYNNYCRRTALVC